MIRHGTALLSLLTLFPVSAVAHHGFGTFDLEGEVELQGVITGVDFVNPHSWVYLDVVNDKGETKAWRCEMRAATVLRRSGWSKELFRTGDPIYISGAPDRVDSRSCYLSLVVFADGRSAERYGQLRHSDPIEKPEDRPLRLSSGEPNITGDWAPEQYVMEDPRGRKGGLVPLSVALGETDASTFDRPWGTSEVSFTPAGKQAADSFDMRSPEDNPRMRCEFTSIIFDWTFDGPVNRIIQQDSNIVIQYGRKGFTRQIHMDMDSHPANLTPSRAGHSIGHWKDDVLVVDTVGFLPGYLSPPVTSSDQLHVVERFSLDTENFILRRDYEATDPPIYTDTYIGSDTMKIADLAYAPDECKELTFVDFDGK